MYCTFIDVVVFVEIQVLPSQTEKTCEACLQAGTVCFRTKHECPRPAEFDPGMEQGRHCQETHLCVWTRVARE